MTPEERLREIAKLDHADYRAEVADRLRYQVEFAQSGLRSLTLVNGGAIIGLFTFIGNETDKSALYLNIDLLWLAFASFVFGLFCSVSASICAFFSQYYHTKATNLQVWNKQEEILGGASTYDEKPFYNRGLLAERIGFVACGGSLLGFVSGAGCALFAVIPTG